MQIIDWVGGDILGMELPAHGAALAQAGAPFLTQAFRATGALTSDNHVIGITRLQECSGGSTGRKFLLDVEYQQPCPALHTALFVKFSRDFDDEIRDRGRDQLEPEVRLALLSRDPGFPIAVPACYFADYHRDSGTGVLITQRVPFGRDGIEPLYAKCLDYEVPEPLAHYQALVRALARLAGTHKAGKLPASVEREFAFDAAQADASLTLRYNVEQLLKRVQRLADFAADYPGLLPDNIRTDTFFEQLRTELPRFVAHEAAIRQWLRSDDHYIALIHWNANIDNGWFWRDQRGELQCGLLDWGGVGQMNVALALWGALSGAETALWDNHLDALLTLFIDEFRGCGGPALEHRRLKQQLLLYVAMMGISWLLDGPARIRPQLPPPSPTLTCRDPAIRDSELVRTVLQMMVNVLNLWQRHGFGKILELALVAAAGGATNKQ
jgi:hypothetical protein